MRYIGIKENGKNGGCGFFVKETLAFQERKDLQFDYKDEICVFESFWIELDNTIIGVVYNHPRKTLQNSLNI